MLSAARGELGTIILSLSVEAPTLRLFLIALSFSSTKAPFDIKTRMKG